jgi:hypothetical protein
VFHRNPFAQDRFAHLAKVGVTNLAQSAFLVHPGGVRDSEAIPIPIA